MAKVDQIVVGGDVLPGPMPCATLAILLNSDIPVAFIQGNGELAVLAQIGVSSRRGSTGAPPPGSCSLRHSRLGISGHPFSAGLMRPRSQSESVRAFARRLFGAAGARTRQLTVQLGPRSNRVDEPLQLGLEPPLVLA